MQAIIRGDFRFEPKEYWSNVSDTAKEFVRGCLTVDPTKRLTAEEALAHPWLAPEAGKATATEGGGVDVRCRSRIQSHAGRRLLLTMRACAFLSFCQTSRRTLRRSERVRISPDFPFCLQIAEVFLIFQSRPR